jgi:hypothetical protein
MTKRRAWHHAERDDYDEHPAVGNRGGTGVPPVGLRKRHGPPVRDALRRPETARPKLNSAQLVLPIKDSGEAAPQTKGPKVELDLFAMSLGVQEL